MMRRRLKQTKEAGQDSFLDIVTNIVGILIILVMVIGARVQHLSVKPDTAPPPEVAALADEAARLEDAIVMAESDLLDLDEQSAQLSLTVADAGTALSLTLVDAAGCFLGGRLMAGGRLQLQALHQGTADLPQLEPVEAAGPLWATQTSEAMASGVARGLAAAIALAFHDRPQPPWPWQLWLTGGDAPVLMPLLQAQGLQPHHDEGLALAALVALSRPAQDP